MILAIDPGNEESAYCMIIKDTYKPIAFGKVKNEDLLNAINNNLYAFDVDTLVIEKIASYGMAVGATVFDTCIWTGRFVQGYLDNSVIDRQNVEYIYRKEEKMNLCNSMKAKDSNIRQALIDRFAQFDFKNGKGTKGNKDFFYGFSKDVWAAYAVGVTWLDKQKEGL